MLLSVNILLCIVFSIIYSIDFRLKHTALSFVDSTRPKSQLIFNKEKNPLTKRGRIKEMNKTME